MYVCHGVFVVCFDAMLMRRMRRPSFDAALV